MVQKSKTFRLVDFARIAEPTVEDSADNYIRHKFRNTPRWNYNPSRSKTPFVLTEAASREDARNCVVGMGAENGWKYNSEVCDFTFRHLAPRVTECFQIESPVLHIRSDLAIRLEVTTGVVLDGEPAVFWLQPCKTEMFSFTKYPLFGGICKFAFQESDFANLDWLYWDLSAYKQRRRRTRLLKCSSLKPWNYEELNQRVGVFIEAYDLVEHMPEDAQIARFVELKHKR